MMIQQARWTKSKGWSATTGPGLAGEASLILIFGGRAELASGEALARLREEYPGALIVGCSTAGEICGTQVSDGEIVATAVRFEGSRVDGACVSIDDHGGALEAAKALAGRLDPRGLVHVLVLSDGTAVNGSELARGLVASLPAGVAVTGGLSGDGTDFRETVVAFGSQARRGAIAAVGFYGKGLRVGCGSMGGWDPFGPERVVTRSRGNVLYELDGCAALKLYKDYLGAHAADLPSSGLLFPLNLRREEGGACVVRTILAVGEEDDSLTFAGDVPEGATVQLMKANFDRLVDGAQGAAHLSRGIPGGSVPDLAILISCVGRKLVLKQRVEDELEAVREVLGPTTAITGFYSYGEICPFAPGAGCDLHNQTMTITTLTEVPLA